jgi:hypothetical protein
MRAGALLFLCSVGLVAGGACSARSLLTIELKADLTSGERLHYPVINVFRSGTETLVRNVDKSEGGVGELVLILDDTKTSLVVGVYLPSDVEGLVRVEATLRDDACQWHGTSDKIPVHASQTTSTSVALTRDETTCAPASTTDGGASDAKDGGPTLIGDGSATNDGSDASDAPAAPFTCGDYCRSFQLACGGQVQFNESASCIGACEGASWQQGKAASPPANTFACRWDHLKVVTNDAALGCSECYAASPSSPGICAPAAPDAGARDACPPTD